MVSRATTLAGMLMKSLQAALVLLPTAVTLQAQRWTAAHDDVRVMTWNIWHGGREDGEDIGPKKVIDVIQSSGADVIAMQETYGSGERIAEALGYHFHPRGTNVSIHSRYPVLEDLSVHEPFQNVGALLDLGEDRRLAFYSIWLPYSAEIWAEGTRDTRNVDAMLAACEASRANLTAMWAAIEQRLGDAKYQGVPIVIAGDFNSMSHLDYGDVGWDQYGAVIDWPTSRVLSRAGFVDAYRACHPRVDRTADATWTPRFPEQEQDRIDFVHFRGPGARALDASVIRTHDDGFPSDHAAVIATLRFAHEVPAAAPTPIRAVTYNIKHGEGMDGEVDLDRTAGVLAALEPDFVGLQEVDLGTRRTNGVNQANELGAKLGMHPAFGPFMDYQGGRYGMAVLSRHPIVSVESLRLPDGNEPRAALLVEARLPDGSTVLIVNVHFDWVGDDGYRFEQARALAARLADEPRPYLLLGDFNDGPESRTLALFREHARQIERPAEQRPTFPADGPEREIDFVFCAPDSRWDVRGSRVVGERLASDHRPVFVDARLVPTSAGR